MREYNLRRRRARRSSPARGGGGGSGGGGGKGAAPRIVLAAKEAAIHDDSDDGAAAAPSQQRRQAPPRSPNARVRYRRLVESQTNAHEAIPFRSNVEFDEKPRQLLSMVLLLGTVAWLAVAPPSFLAAPAAQGGNRPEETARARMTCYGVLLVTVVYSVLNVRDGLMVRPHPAFWRALHGVMLFYCMFLGALVMLSPDDGRRLIRTLLPVLQLKPGEEDRDPNINYSLVGMCELSWDAFNRQLFSKWFLAHLVGWTVKMMIYRDWRFCLCLSLFFELSELSLQWLIPEFQECWPVERLCDVWSVLSPR